MLHRIPITLKALLATALVGVGTWAMLDYWQTSHLQSIFQTRLKTVVGEQAAINQVVFDQHIQMHQQTVNLLAAQRNLLDYLEQHDATFNDDGVTPEAPIVTPHPPARPKRASASLVSSPSEATEEPAEQGHASGHMDKYTKIRFHKTPPVWLPRPSVLRNMVPLRYVFLVNQRGRMLEVYQGQLEPPPPNLLEPSPLLRQLGHAQIFITNIDGTPFLLTLETIEGREGQPRAMLMLANPLDNAFLANSQGLGGQYAGVVALLAGDTPQIIASNKPYLTPPGTPLTQLMRSYLVAGQSFFEYAASDMTLQLITLVSTESFETLTQSILQVERQQRFVSAAALSLACLFIVLWITHTIRQVTRQISDFSKNVLGRQPTESRTRDELSILRERFQDLSQEIISTRDNLQAELEVRRKAEREVRKLSQAVEQSPSAVMICDLTGKIVYVNSQFTRLTGYTSEEVWGHNPRLLKSGETPDATYQELWNTITSGQVWKGKLYNRRKDGSTYWEMNTISTLHPLEQDATLYLAIKEDITPRIIMEKAVQQAQEASEAANQVKNDFLSNISHELRTPANIITGCASLLLDQEFGEINNTQRKYLRNVMSSAEHLAVMISDLLDLSKVNSEQFILETSFFDLPGLAKGTCAAIEAQATKKGLKFSCQVEPDVPAQVKGDPVRLRQALLHLLRNALKFTPTGHITLTVTASTEVCNNTQSVCFTITDTGIGIPTDKQETIFDLFAQADTSSTRRYEGTGLGLTISSNLIELMGGTIHLKSKVNEGSAFSITIPFVLPTESTDARKTAVSPLPAGLKPLVIAKNPVNRMILKKLLTSLGLHVDDRVGCHTVDELRARATRETWDFICLECASGGLEEIVKLREDASLASLPVILFSNLSEHEHRHAEQLSGVYCLHRPMQRTQLCVTVRQALNIPYTPSG